MEKNISITNLDFLSGGGDMGKRIRNFDWGNTPLGDPETWEQGLKTCVRIILTSAQPMFVWWGPSLISIYNDQYAHFLGVKHPAALGAKAEDIWREIWDLLLPKIKSVEQNEGTYDDSMLFIMERKGYQEEVYVSFCYSPVPGDDGTMKGLFCVCTDNTERVINERSLQTLRELGAIAFDEKSLQIIYQNVAEALSKNNKDFPFATVYKIENTGRIAEATASTGANNKQYLLPAVIALDAPTMETRDFCQAYDSNKLTFAEIVTQDQEIPKGEWQKASTNFVYIPITAVGSSHPYAIIFAALNPYRLFDNSFKQFCELIGERVSLEINKMLAIEEERKRAEELEQIDKAKTVFFSNISHEFRTPLTLILNPLEELLNQPTNNLSAIERQNIETTHRNAVRLLKLVNTLLDFSRIESGRQQASYTLTDLVALTTNLAANFRAVIEKAGMQLIIKADTVIQPVYVDRQMWEKIVFNLLSNAFKYTLAGSITVEVTAEGKYAVLKIIDTGVGIPQAELPHMFERFHRVQHVTGRTFEGTGIGLSLIKEFVLLHKGEIGVESELGKGSTFTVRIPIGKAHLPQQQIMMNDLNEQEGILTSTMFVEEAGTLLVRNNKVNDVPADRNGLPLVLVVDDNADMRDHLRSVLMPHFEIVTANNGQEALQKIQQQPPSLILSDIMMPVLDGIGLLQQVKANKATAHIPVILLTARAGEESKIVGWETGADDYLTKPFSSKELISRIASQIKTQQIRTEAMTDIAEQRNYAKKLEEMNGELTKMNEELTSFAYVSSHDLQEPLRKIQMFSKRILEKEINSLSDEGKNFFYRMDNAASRMQLLINDLLAYSRTNTSKKHFEKTDLNLLLAEVKQELMEKIIATNSIIEYGPLPVLSIIPFQFKQLFTNLIANSIKFARPDVPPRITIKCEVVDGQKIDKPTAVAERKYWKISVADNGTGFDPKFSEQIFGLFQRLHGRRDYEGTGIGLAIAKKVVENHNGIISAEGIENEGATIHLYLPA
ncbi:multi-sensor signal transduction histidine kinase [Niastella koreensis GR20-10]|uniref:histidine kinase n=2 Tax=Niastella koreensis TaxID=354356 RepID=G8T860_NIAKG|nr:ATP-binding protein [Niastella koreensis]AEV98011.1 multi-sensor signal transduction histidine kinase [Niastella koreensis GR20-10]